MFTPGRELSGAFYRDIVRPQLRGRPHAAALLGWGSDVLGFDTERSTDHGWGPRLLIFVEGAPDVPLELPDEYAGRPVRYGWDGVPEQHHVTVTGLAAWLVGHLGFDATREVALEDWLVTPQQKLLEVVGGSVYADELGELTRVRERLAWYPDEVWRWMLACQWRRLAQEEAFVQRTAEVGDDLGSLIVAARLVRDLMRLALLQARRYAPYGKWVGSAFAALDHDDGLDAHLRAALRGDEAALGVAFVAAARRFNALGVTEPLEPTLRPFHTRPAQVLDADRFTEACLATVTDPKLRALPLIGAIDQWVDSADLLSQPEIYRQSIALITCLTRV
jgi:Domain of unknown function (DUF4037)